jgi:hypothetical protein
MNMKRCVWLALVAAAACGASIRPELKASTDQLARSATGAHQEAAPRSYRPMRWAEGQWILLRQVNAKGEPSVTRVAIIGREAGGFWIEQETQDYYRRTFSKILYARQPETADDAVDVVRKLVSRGDDGKVQELDFTRPDPGLALTKAIMRSTIKNLAYTVPEVGSSEREDATVAAGRFRGCAKVPMTVSFGPVTRDLVTWYHPAVPLSGAVKGQSADGEWKTELLDYGLTGAVSRMP